jgi:L-amino acid N-acyltransferase YncA
MKTLFFSTMTASDWPEVKRIYEEGIATGSGTFEGEAAASWDDFIRPKIAACCFVGRDENGVMLGWAVLSPYSARKVYAGVAEAGVYVAETARGCGVGSAIMIELIRVAETQGIWTIQGATFPENTGSIALQQKHGFRIVGRRERIGKMKTGPFAGQWRDTILLERRSLNVGRD